MVLAVGLASTLSVNASATDQPKNATPLNCRASFNPYAQTQSALHACGFSTFARGAAHAMPGGGTSYDYQVLGSTVRHYVPPKGFQPDTASDAQLNEYGFPPRPAPGAARTRWESEMRGWKGMATPPPFLTETRTSADSKYFNTWSGYAVTGAAGTYTHAEGWYVEPSFYSSVCSTNSEVTWAGIGGYYGKTDVLAQDGTAWQTPGIHNHQAWWQIVPPIGAIVAENFYGHEGYLFDASTRWLGNNTYRFWMYDYDTATTDAFDVTNSHYTFSGDSAEVIAERPQLPDGSFSNLSNFETLQVAYSNANGVGIDHYSPTGTRHGIHMIDSSNREMATPGSILSGGEFTIRQDHCN